ncbi:MAG: response regulator [Verrucomicrobiota bacterium]|jgi:DNA-binding response OmpR family regulator
MTNTGNYPLWGQLQDAEQTESQVTTGKARILIVEDDTPLAMMMVHVLSCASCDVLVANTGKKGLEFAQENRFDLIALDTDLPDINGLEICSELKQRHLSRHTPVIFVSGRIGEQDVERGLEVGAVDYIEKPFEMTDFVFRIISHVKTKNCSSNILDENTNTNAQSLCNTP